MSDFMNFIKIWRTLTFNMDTDYQIHIVLGRCTVSPRLSESGLSVWGTLSFDIQCPPDTEKAGLSCSWQRHEMYILFCRKNEMKQGTEKTLRKSSWWWCHKLNVKVVSNFVSFHVALQIKAFQAVQNVILRWKSFH